MLFHSSTCSFNNTSVAHESACESNLFQIQERCYVRYGVEEEGITTNAQIEFGRDRVACRRVRGLQLPELIYQWTSKHCGFARLARISQARLLQFSDCHLFQ